MSALSFLIRLLLLTASAGPFLARRSRAGPFAVFLIVVVWSAWFHLPEDGGLAGRGGRGPVERREQHDPTARAVRPDLSFCMGYTSLAAHWGPGP